MGNTPKKARPSTARKHTRTSEEKRTAELEQGVRIKYDDDVYEVRIGDLTSLDILALRREAGMSFQQALEALREGMDIDLIAVFIWLARRARGERMLRLATVAQTITYESVDELLDIDDDEEPPGESQPGDD